MKTLEWARKVQAIAQNGLTFCKDPYDIERYEQLQCLVSSLLSTQLEISKNDASNLWSSEKGYATPKIDVRSGLFLNGQILLVRERSDGKWTLPGGWADINDSPAEAAVRELEEESGFKSRAIKLAAVYDRNKHEHPTMLYHVYKLFFICEMIGGQATTSYETDDIAFFDRESLPELSVTRVTKGQIERLFMHEQEKELPTDFD
jgi:ADP-ribose pyrophosphatase YjhB (NUDIX family)